MFFGMLHVLEVLCAIIIYTAYLRPHLRRLGHGQIFLKVFAPTILLVMVILAAAYFWICDHHFSPWFIFIAGSCMGLLFLWGFMAVLYVVLRRIFHLANLRQFYRVFEAVFAVSMLIVTVVPFIQGNISPHWVNLVLPVNNWQGPPMKIVQLTDLHLGTIQGRKYLQEVVKQVNAIKPDLVLITGDILDHKISSPAMAHLLFPLQGLESKLGNYFVLGNHDTFSDIYALIGNLRSFGVTTLLNESVLIDHRLNLAGSTDPAVRRWDKNLGPNWRLIEQKIDQRYPVLLLSHRPNFQREINHELVDVMLMGHTHGGQMFPFSMLVYAVNDFFKGLYSFHPRFRPAQDLPVKAVRQTLGRKVNWHPEYKWYYVSQGTGSWGPPMRLFSFREITVITLKAAPEENSSSDAAAE